MRRHIAILAAAVVAAGVPTAAQAGTRRPITCTAQFTHHPENANPVWAYDTFTRTTKFMPTKGGYKAIIHDRGTFTTVPGVKSDSGDVLKSQVTGHFSGTGTYLVTTTGTPTCRPGESYDGMNDPATSTWPVHYFAQASTDGITGWEWTYRTCREWMIEMEKGVSGHITGKRCHAKKSPTPSPTPTSTGSPSTSPTGTPTPTTSPTSPAGGEAPPATPVPGTPHFTG